MRYAADECGGLAEITTVLSAYVHHKLYSWMCNP